MHRIVLEKWKSGTFDESRIFHPSEINGEWIWTEPALTQALTEAASVVGELKAVSRLTPNIDRFIGLYAVREAVKSGRIEGTRTNVEEALQKEDEIPDEKRDDWREIQNYIQALQESIAALNELPFSLRLIRMAHQKLLQGVRGENKMPGEFRRTQNWIGGATLADAVFVPPPHTEVMRLMGDLESFLQNDRISTSPLVRAGIAHYQFETIHPFLDGNGRIGRLLVVLYLLDQKLLLHPTLYLSAFFEKHKPAYYDKLMRVRERHDMAGWLKFFLHGVRETAEAACNLISAVVELKKTCEEKIKTGGKRTANGLKLLDELFARPSVGVADVAEMLNVTHKTAGDLVEIFVDIGILHEKTGFKRNRVFLFRSYVDLFNN